MKILLTEPDDFSGAAKAMLEEAGCEVHAYDGPLTQVAEKAAAYDGLIIRLGVQWTADALAKAKSLRFIATPTTGLDHIDLAAAEKQGVDVLSLRGLAGLDQITSTPEHAFALMLSLLRHIVPAARSVLGGQWNRDLFVGHQLRGKTVGVVGLGRTGKRFADMLQAFHVRIVYYDPYVESVYDRCESLEALAQQSDIIALHAVLNEKTEGLLDKAFFDACKTGAFLVNTARGALVNEEALLDALKSGKIRGAALDVVRAEPEAGASYGSPLLDYARHHENVILTPHIAGATYEAMRATEEMIVREIIRRFVEDS